jgi:hypothetical protein
MAQSYELSDIIMVMVIAVRFGGRVVLAKL